jgi:hypothetical protein
MGCASSSPLISGAGGPGGIVDTAKKSGENVLNGMSKHNYNKSLQKFIVHLHI